MRLYDVGREYGGYLQVVHPSSHPDLQSKKGVYVTIIPEVHVLLPCHY